MMCCEKLIGAELSAVLRIKYLNQLSVEHEYFCNSFFKT